MKIMVTGALGNVGSYVIKYLLERKQEVKASDIDIEKLNKKFGETVTSVYFDFTKPETFKEALKGVDRVFIMRPPHLGKPEDLKPFIEALKKCGTIKLVSFLSLLGIEKNTRPPHYKIEKFVEVAGLPYCHIRPSFFMQNISGVHAHEIKYFDNIVVPVKKALTSFIDAEDIGELIAEVLTNHVKHTNTAYSITGPKSMDYFEIAEILSDVLKRQITYANPKPRFAKKYWLELRKLDHEYTTVMCALYLMTRFGAAKVVNDTFKQIMHKEPTDFKTFAIKNKQAWEK